MDTAADGCACVVLVILCSAGALMGGWCLRDNSFKVEAVKHGAATWVVADDGTTTFRWIEHQPCAFELMQMKSIEDATKGMAEQAVRECLKSADAAGEEEK